MEKWSVLKQLKNERLTRKDETLESEWMMNNDDDD